MQKAVAIQADYLGIKGEKAEIWKLFQRKLKS